MRRAFEGWTLFFEIAGAVLLVEASLLFTLGYGEEGLRAVVRASARISLVLFCLAFAASSLRVLLRGPGSAWLLRNRRALGVGFAFSHGTHALALLFLARDFPRPFVEEVDALTLVGGGLAYLFVIAMAATSSDAAQRAMGMGRWRLLHEIGGYYVGLVFLFTYLPVGLAGKGTAMLGSLLLLATWGVRVAAAVRARRQALSREVSA